MAILKWWQNAANAPADGAGEVGRDGRRGESERGEPEREATGERGERGEPESGGVDGGPTRQAIYRLEALTWDLVNEFKMYGVLDVSGAAVAVFKFLVR